jgi:AraC-like DNA-binding protein
MILNLEEYSHIDQKLLKKINQFIAKGKIDKFKTAVASLENNTKDKESEECKETIYIFSILSEEYPDIITKKIIKRLEDLITAENAETRLNAIILYGTKLIERMENEDKEISGDEIDNFIELLEDKVPEIQGNVIFFIEQFPEEYYDYILPKLELFTSILEITENDEIVEAILFIFGNIWEITLPIKISVFNSLVNIYESTTNSDKEKRIIKFLSDGFRELNRFLEENKKAKSDEIAKFLMKSRGPMVKIYNIEEVAREEGMSSKDVQKNFEKIKGTDEIFRFFYRDKKNYFVEIELQPFIQLLNKNKLKIEDIMFYLEENHLDTISLLNILIKKLVKSKFIRGFLSKNFFFPYDYIKESLMNDIKRKGVINLDEHSKIINYQFILSIVEEINSETKFKGIFTKNKSVFLTLSTVMKEVEKCCIKDSICDLSDYKEKYLRDDFYLIESESKKYFTKYNDGYLWLTNIGYTRITNKFKEGQLIGFIKLQSISEEFEIPISICKTILEEWIEAKPGLWDSSDTTYYFTKYIKERLRKLETIASPEEKIQKEEELAKELNLNREVITEKLNQERAEIIQTIKKKPSININAYAKALGMKKTEFIAFVNNLNIEYLISEKEMIFDKNKIQKQRNKIKSDIEKRANKYSYNDLSISRLARDLRFSEKMILELVKELFDEKKVKGVMLKDEIIITEAGIVNQIKGREIFEFKDLFEEFLEDEEDTIILSEKDNEYLENIVVDLINNGQLVGIYDAEKKEFRSEETLAFNAMKADKADAKELIKLYTGYMGKGFDKIKEIYAKKEIKPGDVKRKDFILKNIRDDLPKWKQTLDRLIVKAEVSFDNLDDGDFTFGDMLEADEKKEEKQIDGEALIDVFNQWRDLLNDIDKEVDRIPALKMKLKENPDDEAIKDELDKLLTKLKF